MSETSTTPYGGEKLSGLDRFNGRWTLDALTTEHWVGVQHERRTYPLQDEGENTHAT